jgi:hypothetical protein
MFLADVITQQGYLSLPFHRVYFNDGSVHQEALPDTRLKIPLAVRASYFLGDNIIIRGYYRYYTDDWKLTAHTLNLEIPVKLSPAFSVSPFYRYYTQTETKYFKGYGLHTTADQYHTSNFDLSGFDSNFLGAGFKLTPIKGVFGIRSFHTVEMRYGHYTKTTQMVSDILASTLSSSNKKSHCKVAFLWRFLANMGLYRHRKQLRFGYVAFHAQIKRHTDVAYKSLSGRRNGKAVVADGE